MRARRLVAGWLRGVASRLDPAEPVAVLHGFRLGYDYVTVDRIVVDPPTFVPDWEQNRQHLLDQCQFTPWSYR